MAAPDGRSHWAETEAIGQLAGVVARLDGMHETLRDLSKKVGEQNGRVGKLEAERAAMQVRSVDAARAGLDLDERMDKILERCECRMGSVNERLGKVESDQSRGSGAGKARTDLIRDAFVFFALLISAWQLYETRTATHQPAPAHQHQAVK